MYYQTNINTIYQINKSMSSPITNSASPFEYSGVWFEPISPDNHSTFGIIKLDATDKIDSSKKVNILEIKALVDNSGSMGDKCEDGRSKQHHVNFAVEQLIRKISENCSCVNANITINSFDDRIVPVVLKTMITPDQVDSIVQKSSKISPYGGTNIQQVLVEEASNQPNASVDKVFMLLSDGQDTTSCGNDKLVELASKIDVDTRMVLFGVGIDHAATLFKEINKVRVSGNYTFVSNVESISIAISEITYGLINRLLKNVVITVQNGVIYDWSSNKWMTSIRIDDIVVGRQKTFNVRSNDPLNFRVEITAMDTDAPFTHTIKDVVFDKDLTYDKYRQQTLELLAESAKVDTHFDPAHIIEIKTRLKNMMVELKAYMDANKLRDDTKFQVLCDDIFMCHQTMGSPHGQMYAAARQTSQGSQNIYNNVMKRDLTGRLSQMNYPSQMNCPKLTRGITACVDQMNIQDPYSLDEDDLPQIPRMKHQISSYVTQMNVEQVQDQTPDIISIPSFARGVSMYVAEMNLMNLISRQEQLQSKDEDDVPQLPTMTRNMSSNQHNYYVPLARSNATHLPISIPEDDECEDDPMNNHQMLNSDESPYANMKEISFIREVSISSNTPSSI